MPWGRSPMPSGGHPPRVPQVPGGRRTPSSAGNVSILATGPSPVSRPSLETESSARGLRRLTEARVLRQKRRAPASYGAGTVTIFTTMTKSTKQEKRSLNPALTSRAHM